MGKNDLKWTWDVFFFFFKSLYIKCDLKCKWFFSHPNNEDLALGTKNALLVDFNRNLEFQIPNSFCTHIKVQVLKCKKKKKKAPPTHLKIFFAPRGFSLRGPQRLVQMNYFIFKHINMIFYTFFFISIHIYEKSEIYKKRLSGHFGSSIYWKKRFLIHLLKKITLKKKISKNMF